MIDLQEISDEEKAAIAAEMAQNESEEEYSDADIEELLTGIAEIVASLITPHLMIIAEKLGYKYPAEAKEFINRGLNANSK